MQKKGRNRKTRKKINKQHLINNVTIKTGRIIGQPVSPSASNNCSERKTNSDYLTKDHGINHRLISHIMAWHGAE